MNEEKQCLNNQTTNSRELGSILLIEDTHNPKVGDVYQLVKKDGSFRVWKVTGVFLGGLRQENSISLKVLDRAESDHELHIPVDIFKQTLNLNRV